MYHNVVCNVRAFQRAGSLGSQGIGCFVGALAQPSGGSDEVLLSQIRSGLVGYRSEARKASKRIVSHWHV